MVTKKPPGKKNELPKKFVVDEEILFGQNFRKEFKKKNLGQNFSFWGKKAFNNNVVYFSTPLIFSQSLDNHLRYSFPFLAVHDGLNIQPAQK
ncbi:MAG: hypothetical protein WBL27_06770 [Salinimicrobium sp.]